MTPPRKASKHKPVARGFSPASIPAELRKVRQWVTYNPTTKAPHGDVTDPATWLTFREAQRRMRVDGVGVGFAFTPNDPYCGIDLDNVRNPETGVLLPLAEEIVRNMASYTEVSPSGRGAHIITRATLPSGARHKIVVGQSAAVEGEMVRLEMYDKDRYFTVTGNVYGGRGKIRRRQPAVDALVQQHRTKAREATLALEPREPSPPTGASLSDDGVLAALRDQHKQDYKRYFETGGKEGDDDSSLDYRLARALIDLVGDDPKRIETLMRRSKLVRSKWDSKRGASTYIRETIRSALRDAQHATNSSTTAPAVESPYPPIDPAETEQDGRTLFDDLNVHLGRYVSLGDHERVFLALWTLHTHALDAADQTPYVHISSPAAACGKSTLITVLQEVVNKGVRVVGASPSFVFRVLDADAPTLLIDEAHRWLQGGSSDDLHAVLHDGYHRGGRVGRVSEARDGSTKKFRPQYFKTWGAKVFAGIGRDLTAELASRCVPVRLVRASPTELMSIEKIRSRPHAKRAGILRGRCARWAADNIARLKRARPGIPESLDGRQQDVWEPLLAIADTIDADVARRAREAAITLHDAPPRTLGEELLHDLLTIFAACSNKRAVRKFFVTRDLIRELVGMDERPWESMPSTQKQLTPHTLARMLERFDIKSRRPKHSEQRGYLLSAFLPVWSRYLTDDKSRKLIRRLS